MTTHDAGGPDAADIALGELRVVPFPAECEWDPLRVHISDHAHEAILTHALESDHLELCGVLIGDIVKDERGPFLLITHTIRGEHADNRAAQVTFTQEAWAHVHRVKDTEHDGRSIVGWYHTHPGFGVFLSPMDLFIHEHFFNLPWQVAFVVDPRTGEEGLFTWRKGKPRRTCCYWVGDDQRLDLAFATASRGGSLASSLDRMNLDIADVKAAATTCRQSLRRFGLGLRLHAFALAAVVAAGIICLVWPERWSAFIAGVRQWIQ